MQGDENPATVATVRWDKPHVRAAVILNAKIPPPKKWDPEFQPPADCFCSVCLNVIEKSQILDRIGQKPDIRELPTERWPHHSNEQTLLQSAQKCCHLCSLLYMQCCKLPSGTPDGLPSGQLTLQVTYNSSLRPHQLGFGIEDAYAQLGPNSLSQYLERFMGRNKEQHEKWKTKRSAWRTTSTASETTMDLARGWLKSCQNRHKECSEQGLLPRGRPRRLLKLSKVNDYAFVKLSEVSPDEDDLEYLTLSHCWAKAPLLTLRRENYDSFLESIPIADFPQTFRDAVDITLRLGYQALWIDALCIIQDDSKDWKAEALNMGYIYANSVCTIAALSSAGSSGGCYAHRNPLAYLPCKIRTKNGTIIHLESARAGGLLAVVNPDQNMGHFDAPPLHGRGLVVQERALSPRTLYYSNGGIYWECYNVSISESDPVDCTRGYPASWKRKLGVGWILRRPELNDGSDNESGGQQGDVLTDDLALRWRTRQWHSQWWHLVEIYTGCNLTKMSDRWPAISGIAKIIKLAAESPIIAGMYRTHIMKDMQWTTTVRPANRLKNGQPSWSWLSTDGAVRLDGLALYHVGVPRYTARIMSLPSEEEAEALEKDLSNRVTNSELFLKIRAPLIKCRMCKAPTYGILGPKPIGMGTLNEEVSKLIAESQWSPDVAMDIDKSQDVWALQWTMEDSGMRGLVLRPLSEDHAKWCRIGQFYFGIRNPVENGTIGELAEINLY